MLISMEIFILFLLVHPARPPPSGAGRVVCPVTPLAPCCAQASRDYQSEADVSIIPRHRHALLPSFFTTHTHTHLDLSDDGLITLCKLSPVSHSLFFFFSVFIILTFHKTAPLPFFVDLLLPLCLFPKNLLPALSLRLPHQRRIKGHKATGMEYKCSQQHGSMGNQSSKDSFIYFMNPSSSSIMCTIDDPA